MKTACETETAKHIVFTKNGCHFGLSRMIIILHKKVMSKTKQTKKKNTMTRNVVAYVNLPRLPRVSLADIIPSAGIFKDPNASFWNF